MSIRILCSAAALATAPLATHAAAQTPIPDIVDQALAAAEARAEPDQRWAFTRSITMNGAEVVARYDPSRTEGAEWTMLAPASEAALSDDQNTLLEGLRAEADADRNLMLGASGENFGMRRYLRDGGLALAEDGATEKRYSFRPPDGIGLTAPPQGDPPEMAEHLDAELVIATSEPTLAELRLTAPESFKPAAVARINTLNLSWRFGEVEPGGPLAILGTQSQIAGRAMFRGFDVDTEVVNRDFARVDAVVADPQPAD